MGGHARFHIRSLADLQEELGRLDLDLPAMPTGAGAKT